MRGVLRDISEIDYLVTHSYFVLTRLGSYITDSLPEKKLGYGSRDRDVVRQKLMKHHQHSMVRTAFPRLELLQSSSLVLLPILKNGPSWRPLGAALTLDWSKKR
jgi:hypothetical protein